MNSIKVMYRTMMVILLGLALICLIGYAIYHQLPYLILLTGCMGGVALLYKGYKEAKLIQRREIKREIRSKKYGQEN